MRQWLCSAAGIFAMCGAHAQNHDILAGSLPTPIYVETAYEGNENRSGCDWHVPVAEFLEIPANDSRLSGNCTLSLRLRGVINREGAQRFQLLLEKLAATAHRPEAVLLNSKGGDADAAMRIGRLLRTHEVFQRTPGGVRTAITDAYDAACFSACVVIFAAGHRRSAEFNIHNDTNLPSRLGIHGPGHFDANTSAYDTSANNRQLQRINVALKRYFAEIDVDESIVDDMYAVPFDEIQLLSRQDLRGYGIEVD